MPLYQPLAFGRVVGAATIVGAVRSILSVRLTGGDSTLLSLSSLAATTVCVPSESIGAGEQAESGRPKKLAGGVCGSTAQRVW